MSPKTSAPSATDGYWTIQVVNADRNAAGRRFVCRALDDFQAQSIAGHLSGSDRGVLGYDYHRIDNPAGLHARTLGVGQSEAIFDGDTWAALQSARRGA